MALNFATITETFAGVIGNLRAPIPEPFPDERLEQLALDTRLATWENQIMRQVPLQTIQTPVKLQAIEIAPVPSMSDHYDAWEDLQWQQMPIRDRIRTLSIHFIQYQRYCDYLSGQRLNAKGYQDFIHANRIANQLRIQLIDGFADLAATFSHFYRKGELAILNGSTKKFQGKWHDNIAQLLNYVQITIAQPELQNVDIHSGLYQENAENLMQQAYAPLGNAAHELGEYLLTADEFTYTDTVLSRTLMDLLGSDFMRWNFFNKLPAELQAVFNYLDVQDGRLSELES